MVCGRCRGCIWAPPAFVTSFGAFEKHGEHSSHPKGEACEDEIMAAGSESASPHLKVQREA